MTFFPNAKINIGLYITGKRDDGYHNIESLFYPVGLRDAIEFVTGEPGSDDELNMSGFDTDCDMGDNLVIKALRLMRKDFNLPPLKIHLHKAIPPGSGLGGGSSDAAFMLRYLNRHFRLEADEEELTRMALQLGSDCAFFINNRPSFISGRGEVIRDSALNLAGKYLLLVYPGININTAEAYRMVKPINLDPGLEEKIRMPAGSWKSSIRNDFQDAIIQKHPLIGTIIEDIYASGALYSSLSGSGSAVYGIYDGIPPARLEGHKLWTWRGAL
ncbi:MAG: 4-(cytidine 5'-diphospho)-2-C-methyl-D-erythritol kinase [Bacteroidota bacterium]